jgi:hypothetical protein
MRSMVSVHGSSWDSRGSVIATPAAAQIKVVVLPVAAAISFLGVFQPPAVRARMEHRRPKNAQSTNAAVQGCVQCVGFISGAPLCKQIFGRAGPAPRC